MLFCGQWRSAVAIDGKSHRLHVPKTFRQGLTQLYVYRDGGNMMVYGENIAPKLPPAQLGLFFPVKVDDWGRIVIPEALFQAVFKDSKKVIWVGWGDHFECHGE